MKKTLFTLLIVVLTATIFTGCKKDEKDSISIVGNWKLENSVVSRINKGQVTSSESDLRVGGVVFNGNGTFSGSFGEGPYKVVDGTGLSTTDFQGSKLIMDFGDFKDFDIIRLTASELILYSLLMDDAENAVSIKMEFKRM
jgi:hypothetical protein